MKKYYFFLGLIILLIVTACSPYLLVDEPVNDPGMIYTQSAQTLEAMLTQMASPEATPTQISMPIPTSTNTPSPTATASPLPTSTPITHCDWVSFVKDVTIPDASVWIQGTPLTKTWRLKNRGTCIWTPDYALVFTRGTQMGAPVSVQLTGYVYPGETIDISVPLTVPETPGHYIGYWMLRNASGVLFGYGDKADQAFYVDLYSTDRRTGSVTGRVCFPSEILPPMTIYLQRVNSDHVIEVKISQNQTSYQAALEPGTYYAYAWTNGFTAAGAYTYDDHTLRSFEVKRGVTTQKIDVCDWYGGPGSVPYPPSFKSGAISGRLAYPSENIPPLRIVAFNLSTGAYFWVETVQNQFQYEIKNLTPGDYSVVAYYRGSGLAGGYTNAVLCGMLPHCEDHNLAVFHLSAGTSTFYIDPIDWYAPDGTFPPDPTP